MITIDLTRAKETAHEIRRAKRQAVLAPLDVQATIPMFAEQAEADRAVIREADAELQINIDSAETADDLLTLIKD